MKKIYTLAFALVASAAAMAANYTTAGNGTNYTLQQLAQIAGSGVTQEGSTFTMADSLTIADGDKFTFDSGATLLIGNKVTFSILGEAIFAPAAHATISQAPASNNPGKIEFRKDNSTVNISNITWDYVGMKIYGTATALNISDCQFQNYVYANSVSGPIGVAGQNSKVSINRCHFGKGEYSSVSGAANMLASYKVENCVFDKSQQVNRNMPMLNLQQGDTIIIRNNVFRGDSTKYQVGAISVANLLGMDADLYVLIEGNTIDSCRYGINIQGKFKNAIIRNNIIRHNKYVSNNNANLGGSGIAIYDSSKSLNLKVSGNTIEDNLWGITVMGGGNINLGKVQVDGKALSETDPEYNEGKNTFKNNGNNGKAYDLAFAGGTSYLTVYAQNNRWTPNPMTAEAIEAVIEHQKDNANEGLAIFTPWQQEDVNAISAPEVAKGNDKAVAIYSINGQRLSKLGSGVNIVRMGDGSTRKVMVK